MGKMMGKMIKDGQSTKADRAPNPSPAQLSAELGTVGEEAGEKILSFNASAIVSISASASAMKSHRSIELLATKPSLLCHGNRSGVVLRDRFETTRIVFPSMICKGPISITCIDTRAEKCPES